MKACWLNTWTFFSNYGEHIRKAAISAVETLKLSNQIEIVHQNHEFFEKSLTLYKSRKDKNYSLTDCFSMKIMEEMGITDVLKNDDRVKQEGYNKINHWSDLAGPIFDSSS